MSGQTRIADCQRSIFHGLPHLSIAKITKDEKEKTVIGLVEEWRKEMELNPTIKIGFSALHIKPNQYCMAECNAEDIQNCKKLARLRLRQGARSSVDYFGGGTAQFNRGELFHVTVDLQSYLSEPGMFEEFIHLLKKNESRYSPFKPDKILVFSRDTYEQIKPNITTEGLSDKIETLISTLFDQAMEFRYVSGMGKFIALTLSNRTPLGKIAVLHWDIP